MSSNFNLDNNIPRTGCKDIWNAFMCEDALYSKNDIPLCPSSNEIPKELISFEKAQNIYNKINRKDPTFHIDAYVHFYLDDYKFDGHQSSNIWNYPEKALNIIKHFSGVITPDYSTYADFPTPIKEYNTYRMRAFGKWFNDNNINTINNVRWGTEETWEYCFDGIPKNSIVSIGIVASDLNIKRIYELFEPGFFKMIDIINPPIIIVYGSDNYPCFEKAKKMGIKIVAFPSETNAAYERRK